VLPMFLPGFTDESSFRKQHARSGQAGIASDISS
jgi:hypothetical protein